MIILVLDTVIKLSSLIFPPKYATNINEKDCVQSEPIVSNPILFCKEYCYWTYI